MPSNKELQAQVTALRKENDELKKLVSSGDAAPLQQENERLGAQLKKLSDEATAKQAEWDAAEARWKEQFDRLDAGEVLVAPMGYAAELVVMRRPARLGDRQLEPDDALGVVHLAEGVSLNYLVDAIRNDLAKGEPITEPEAGDDEAE